MDGSNKNRLYYVIIVILSILLIIGVEWYRFFYTPIVLTPTDLYVPKGSSIRSVANDLAHRNILHRPSLFVFIAKYRHVSHLLRAGEYEIPAGATANQVLTQIVSGKVRMREFQIIEGWHFKQVLAALHQNEYLEHNLVGKTLDELTAMYGPLEGNFFPDKYLFARGSSESEVLSNAKKLMTKKLSKAWEERAENLPYKSPEEALIVASLIEKETAVIAERAQIAGVILRRIEKNMFLQIDPTIIYALGDAYTGKLRKEDMAFDSPFNTYKYKGLPPTPIAMPGNASIVAALHPEAGTSLYYVSRGDGSHEFTDNLQAHVEAIEKFLKPKVNQ